MLSIRSCVLICLFDFFEQHATFQRALIDHFTYRNQLPAHHAPEILWPTRNGPVSRYFSKRRADKK